LALDTWPCPYPVALRRFPEWPNNRIVAAVMLSSGKIRGHSERTKKIAFKAATALATQPSCRAHRVARGVRGGGANFRVPSNSVLEVAVEGVLARWYWASQ